MKTITKKIVSIVSGTFLIGSTILSASAMGYPEPFVKNGMFSGNIVVGASSDPADILGAIEVGSSLQYAMKLPASVNSNSKDVSITNGYKVEKSGDAFNYNDDIAGVLQGTSLSEDELPGVLIDGKYIDNEGENKNSITYSQKLQFITGNGILQYAQDDDAAPTAGDYLVIKKNKPLYTYTLDFDSSVNYDNTNENNALDDFKTTTLQIEGKTYTITDVSLTGNNGKLDTISLLSGEAVLWLTQNQPISKMVDGVQHTIEVVDVTEKADACQVKVDGTTAILDLDTVKTIGGVQIGVTDVRAIHAQLQDMDVCQLSVGANEIELRDGSRIKIDDVELDGTKFNFDQTPGELNSISIDYTPRELDDDIYLSKNKAFIDPLFDSWKILYGGISTDYTDYEVNIQNDDSGEFRFITDDHRTITLPIYNLNNQTIIAEGNDVDEKYYANAVYAGANVLDNACQGINDCEGMKVMATPPNVGELHVFEISNINTDDNTVDLRDLTYGRTYNSLDYIENSINSLDLGSFGSFDLLVNETGDNVVVYNTIKSKIKLNNNELLEISEQPNIKFSMTEGDAGSNVLDLNIYQDSNNEMKVTSDWTNPSVPSVESSDHSDESVMVTNGGTKVTKNDDKTKVIIQSPNSDDEVYGNVFISEVNSKIINSGYNGTSYTLNKINAGSAKLDSEVIDVTGENLIVIGGPCSNKVTAMVLGKTFPSCGANSGITPGTAIIKAVGQATGKVSLLVAGWEKENTRMASRILANYDLYNLDLTPGSSYTITGTDLSSMNIVKSS